MLNASSDHTEQDVQSSSGVYKFLVFGLVCLAGLALYLVPPYITVFILSLGIYLFGLDSGSVERWLDTTEAIFSLTLVTEVLVIVGIVFLMKQLRLTWQAIGMRRPKLRDLGYMFVGFGIYLVTYMVVAGLLQDTLDFDQRQELGYDTSVYGVDLGLVFISLVVLPPLVEEILFRGLLYTQIRKAFWVGWSAVIISLLFGAAHLQIGSGNPLLWVAAVDTFVLSMVLVYLREKTGSIWSGVGVHALKNLVAFMILFVFQIA